MSDTSTELPPAARRMFCNRTLNLRGIKAIGFDMDYTLIHYHADEWERRAYAHVKQALLELDWPVAELSFDPELVTRGLVLDVELGNIVKANRFGYVRRAAHGTRLLGFEDQRSTYAREIVSLAEGRWRFLNTLFSLSEACLYSQLVDLLDAGKLEVGLGYADLHRIVRSRVSEAHMEGTLKREIIADPDQFVDLDAELPLALLDLQAAGKSLILITNSEWSYSEPMMRYAFDRHLPEGKTWRDLFELVIVQARKPAFFTQENPVFEVCDDGRLQPSTGPLRSGAAYLGGHAGLVERHLDVPGEDILYVGDHIYADVHLSKKLLRWRTALVVRELESELAALDGFAERQRELDDNMVRKEALEHEHAQLRLQVQRAEQGYGPPPSVSSAAAKSRMQKVRAELTALDEHIAPLAIAAGELLNTRWGPLLRAGNDKSHLARQIERYADIYTSRVSNFLAQTPFVYLRSPRGSMPHDP